MAKSNTYEINDSSMPAGIRTINIDELSSALKTVHVAVEMLEWCLEKKSKNILIHVPDLKNAVSLVSDHFTSDI